MYIRSLFAFGPASVLSSSNMSLTIQTSDLLHVYGDGFKAKQFDGFALETLTRGLIAEEFPSASPLEQAYVLPFVN